MKRNLTLVLAFLMLLTSCAPASQTEPEETRKTQSTQDTTETQNPETVPEETVPEETEPPIPADKLPDDLNFDGATFQTISRLKSHYHGEMFIFESTGESLNDARYNATNKVADRLNIVPKEDYYGLIDYSDNDLPRTYLLAGDTTYDLYNGRASSIVTYASEGYAHNLSEVPYIDLEMPWWNPLMSNDITVGAERYYAIGSHSLSAYDGAYFIIFNKVMMNNLGISETFLNGKTIYDVVKESNWTYDLFDQILASVYADTNGNGEMDDEDRYAFLSVGTNVLPSMLMAEGIRMIDKDENNFLINNMKGNEAFNNAYEKILNTMWNNNAWYSDMDTAADQYTITQDMFAAGRGLFHQTDSMRVTGLRDMDIDFGIIPWPKADETQQNYFTRCTGGEFFIVPITCKNKELDGAVLEAIASEYYRSVQPVYYERTLKGRTTRDEESVDMLDIIYSNLVYDFGDTVYSGDIRDGTMQYLFHDNERNITSKLAAKHKMWQSKLDSMNAGFGKNEE